MRLKLADGQIIETDQFWVELDGKSNFEVSDEGDNIQIRNIAREDIRIRPRNNSTIEVS